MTNCNKCPGPGFDPTEQTGPVYLGGVLGIDVNGVRQPIDAEGIVHLAASAQEAVDAAERADQSAEDAAGSATEAASAATDAAGSATAAAASAAAAQTAAERDVPAAAAAWLAEHVDPETGYVLDDSLTIQGAAADAKAAGDAVLALSRAPAFSVQSPESLWTLGTLLSSSGAESNSTFRMRTDFLDKAIKTVRVNSGYTFSVYAYTEAGGYVGIWNGEEFRKTLPSTPNTEPVYLSELPGDYRFRIVLTRSDSGEITTAEGSNLVLEYDTDPTLTRPGVAADAAAAGDRLGLLEGAGLTSEEIRINVYGTVKQIINVSSRWITTTTGPQVGFWKKIGTDVRAVRVEAGTANAYIAFLKTYAARTTQHLGYPDFADSYPARITVPHGQSRDFLVEPGMNYLFITVIDPDGLDFTPRAIQFIRMRESIPETSVLARALQPSIPHISEPSEATAATLPVQNGVAGVTEYYDAGAKIDGVLYSSLWRDGLDVYWNYNLETYYSALANSASILYTQNYSDRGISNAHAIMGGVCSTFISYLLGLPYFRHTGQLSQLLQQKEMRTLYEIQTGDILLRPGHIALITQVYTDYKGLIQSVDVSEQVAPVAKTINIHMDALEAYLETNNYTIMQNIFGPPRLIQYDGFAHDIIFERGNNTYVEAADAGEMWFYIPDAPATVYCKKDSGSYAAYTLAGAPTKTVNGVTVYDLAACFSGLGDYELTTDQEAEKTCLIKIINTGTITIQNGVLTVSGYANCTPKQYQVAPMHANDGVNDNTAGDPPEGYYCSWNEIKLLDGDSQAIEGIPASGKYKVAVDFETGVGLKRVFSANIGV